MSDETDDTEYEYEVLAAIVGENSYITVEDAGELAEQRLTSAAWAAADATMCARALIHATALLDRMKWLGQPATTTQHLSWPRTGVIPNDRSLRTLSLFASPTTPPALAIATAELAFHMLANPEPADLRVQMRQIGPAMEMYFPDTPDEIPVHVRRLIEPYLRTPSAYAAEVLL